MNSQTLVAMVLLVTGVLGLAYGGFTYTKARHQVDLGIVQFSVDEKEHVNIPLWAGLGLVVVGGVLLVGGRKSG